MMEKGGMASYLLLQYLLPKKAEMRCRVEQQM